MSFSLRQIVVDTLEKNLDDIGKQRKMNKSPNPIKSPEKPPRNTTVTPNTHILRNPEITEQSDPEHIFSACILKTKGTMTVEQSTAFDLHQMVSDSAYSLSDILNTECVGVIQNMEILGI